MRIATWNLKQAVAPKKPLPQLWDWLEHSVAPDIAVLTEAKVPKDGPPPGWAVLWEPEGIGPRRKWGTVIAARGCTIRRLTEVRLGNRTLPLDLEWPAATLVADIELDGERWATLVGMYGVTVDAGGKSCGHGGHSVPHQLRQLKPLFDSDRAKRLIVAGDLNLWPGHVQGPFNDYGLTDLVEYTADDRPPLPGCANCGDHPDCAHLWTHRNGNSPNAAVQQIDFIFASDGLLDEVGRVYGGVGHFTDAWEVSDHAPVVAEFT